MCVNKVDMRLLLVLMCLVAVTSSSFVPTNNSDRTPLTPLKNSILPNPQFIPSTNDDEMEDGYAKSSLAIIKDLSGSCREISLHKCGSSMVRVFRLLDFLPLKKSFEAKCALRKAFFKCMKTEDEPCKKRRWTINHSTRFRKKLVRGLWSTRACVLGFQPEENRI